MGQVSSFGPTKVEEGRLRCPSQKRDILLCHQYAPFRRYQASPKYHQTEGEKVREHDAGEKK